MKPLGSSLERDVLYLALNPMDLIQKKKKLHQDTRFSAESHTPGLPCPDKRGTTPKTCTMAEKRGSENAGRMKMMASSMWGPLLVTFLGVSTPLINYS